jgi:hypothetical protein
MRRRAETAGPGSGKNPAEIPDRMGIILDSEKLSLSDSSHLTAQVPCWQA